MACLLLPLLPVGAAVTCPRALLQLPDGPSSTAAPAATACRRYRDVAPGIRKQVCMCSPTLYACLPSPLRLRLVDNIQERLLDPEEHVRVEAVKAACQVWVGGGGGRAGGALLVAWLAGWLAAWLACPDWSPD